MREKSKKNERRVKKDGGKIFINMKSKLILLKLYVQTTK